MNADERLHRWRLVLGGGDADGTGVALDGEQAAIDHALGAVYDAGSDSRERRGGLGGSAPSVARWLGDIRTYFPSPLVRIIQQDAMERLDLHRLLLEPEVLETVEPDVHLVGTLLALNSVIPQKTRATRPRRLADVDWNTTIRRNLRHYQPEYRTIVAETLVGYGRRQRASLKDVILAVDQSGSMASSVVYSSVFAAVLASLRTLSTRLVVFDTAVVDLSDRLEDPVEVLFGTQLGGGTDINQALAYSHTLVRRPSDTITLLISDLYEGGDEQAMLKRAASIVAGGVRLIVLLALSDDGAPAHDHQNAAHIAALGCPVFACTPAQFPPLMAAAIEGLDINLWAAAQGIAGTRSR